MVRVTGRVVRRMMRRPAGMVRGVMRMMMDLCERNSSHAQEGEAKEKHFVHMVSFKVCAI
jgi:hypothetical protein